MPGLKKGWSAWVSEGKKTAILDMFSGGFTIGAIADEFKVYTKVVIQVIEGTYKNPAQYERKNKMPKANVVDMVGMMEKVYNSKSGKIKSVQEQITNLVIQYNSNIGTLQKELKKLEEDIDYVTAKNYLKAKTLEVAKI